MRGMPALSATGKRVFAAYNRRRRRSRSTRSPQRTGSLWLACAFAAMGLGPVQAQAASETVLHRFKSTPNGAQPYAGVIRDSAGNLYGTTMYGGNESGDTVGSGVVFKLNTSGHETVLYAFTGGTDGANPMAGVIRDSAGNLYGTTFGGGYYSGWEGCGVVFRVNTASQETVLHAFTGADGCSPRAGVIRDSAGNLYGTTWDGGTLDGGVVYKLDTAGQETVLLSFCSLTGCAEGAQPYAGVIRDSAGNLYGTTSCCGTGGGAGTVYKLDTSGQETVLYTFTGGADGGQPQSGVIRDAAGNLYGTTVYGGYGGAPGPQLGLGVVYKLDTAGQQTVLYRFPGGTGGYSPYAGVIRDSAGNVYGTTYSGGTANSGVVYKLDTGGHETVLYSFTGGADGSNPYAGVVRDSAGNLYGTTDYGGTANGGVIYKLDTAGQETVLYSFTRVAGEANPYSNGVIRDSAGNFYGTTPFGGTAGAGAVYKLDTAGQYTVLYSFTSSDYPYGGLTRDSAGNLYGALTRGGTAGWGAVYKLDTAGQYTVLYNFTGGADGEYPNGDLVRDSSGNLYGTTEDGGTGSGVVYKLDTAGTETVLYRFGAGGNWADGAWPLGGVIRDSSGNLYGTTSYGGTAGWGVVYKLDTAGQQTVLYNFTLRADGGLLYTGVIRDAAGNLYGTTLWGGNQNDGVVFKIEPK
jgi:uncharacterized repeat protein (TIGR03803 family)